MTRLDGKLNRKKGHSTSVDLSLQTPPKGGGAGIKTRRYSADGPSNQSSIRSAVVQPQSPTLPPIIFATYVHDLGWSCFIFLTSFGCVLRDRDPMEEEELLSSGQVSPICELFVDSSCMLDINIDAVDHQTSIPFNILHNGASAESSALNLNTDYERKVNAFNQGRPWGNRVYQSRISSWSDPVSARGTLNEDEDGSEGGGDGSMGSEGRNNQSKVRSGLGRESLLGNEDGELVSEPEEYGEESPRRRGLMSVVRR